MSVPSPRRPHRLDAELDALVAREADALAPRKPRGTNGKVPHDPAGPGPMAAEPLAQTADAEREDAPVRAERQPEFAARASRRNLAATKVVGIRHASARPGLSGIPFSAEEEAFVEDAVAFLRRRANADVIIEEIWMHSVPDGDPDADPGIDGDAPDAGEAAAEHAPDERPAPAQQRNRIAPLQTGAARPRSEGEPPAAGAEQTKSPVPSRAPKAAPDEPEPNGPVG